VVLAACHAASAGPNQHRTWGLADAFVAAGARAVIASPGPIADAAAPRFFAAVRARIAGGASASVALRDERLLWTEPAQRAWIDSLVVFEATKEAPP
jgi:CHAT domain-containing protein